MDIARPSRLGPWPDALASWLGGTTLAAPLVAEPGTALVPPASCRVLGAVPVLCASHAGTLPRRSTPRLPETRSGRSA